MSDSYVQLPVDGSGKKLDTEQVAVGAHTVERERNQLAGRNADDVAVVTDADPAGSDHGLVTREAPPASPQVDTASSTDLAAGASADLDSSSILSGKTGKLEQIEVVSCVPIKVEIKTVADGIETTMAVRIGWHGEVIYSPPKGYVAVAHSAAAGFDGFRVTVTNLVAGVQATNVYVSFYYDEVG